ncbi:MAG TPA: hypothetical protein VMX79_04750 [bacterium]|nr:hypothetical protein [bacterium]
MWLAFAGCRAVKGPSQIKAASAYRADLFHITEKINAYLAENTPEDTQRRELQQTVGATAHEYAMLAAEAGPLQGKTGDAEYGEIAARAEDGEIVAGNLAGALAADPAQKPEAVPTLAAAVDDWVAYNDELASRGNADAPFKPNRWWETPPWRRTLGTGGEPGLGTEHGEKGAPSVD